ncbi:MAG: hypothetical protein U0793_04255 [Gemmataceae bacterium]
MKSCLIAAVLAPLVACLMALAGSGDEPKEKKASMWTGKLQTGVFAIGGETTGIVLKTKDKGAFELDLGKNKELRAQAEKLNGKEVTVEGTLTIRKGVEIRERRIITATSLKEVK